jgi:hypothetical protein
MYYLVLDAGYILLLSLGFGSVPHLGYAVDDTSEIIFL